MCYYTSHAGPSGQVPSDGVTVVYSSIAHAMMAFLVALLLLSLTLGFSLIVANVVWRRNRLVELCRPCIICYVAHTYVLEHIAVLSYTLCNVSLKYYACTLCT